MEVGLGRGYIVVEVGLGRGYIVRWRWGWGLDRGHIAVGKEETYLPRPHQVKDAFRCRPLKVWRGPYPRHN